MTMVDGFADVSSVRLKRNRNIRIVELSTSKISFLEQLLSTSSVSDVYVRSPLYYAFTGRNGLWHFKSDEVEFVGCVHPNDKLARLLFMPFVSDQDSFQLHVDALIGNLHGCTPLSNWIKDCEYIYIARVPRRFIRGYFVTDNRIYRDGFLVEAQQETKLDWAYPSYDISVQSSSNPIGPALSAYRNKLNKFRQHGVDTVTFGEVSEWQRANAVRSVSERWGANKLQRNHSSVSSTFSDDDLLAPYKFLAKLTVSREAPLDGIFLRKGSEYIAFWLWEDNRRFEDPVPCLAALHATNEPGCSEYLHYQAARRLLSSGYKEMCIGGSETEGLDLYKQKFAPVRSHELCTLRLTKKKEIALPAVVNPKDGSALVPDVQEDVQDQAEQWVTVVTPPIPQHRHSIRL
jgi:hypothetical protein